MASVDEKLLRAAAYDDRDFDHLINTRTEQVRHFLGWAAACEADAPDTSLRLRARPDVDRCRSTLSLFEEPWWATVVYSCFDSPTGTKVAAEAFRRPLPPDEVEAVLRTLRFPRGSVQHHRTQSGLRGAKASLASACAKADAIEDVLVARGMAFEERFERLTDINVHWWGRTTHFDLLVRAGAIAVAGEAYGPGKAYLGGSTGPAAGFEKIFGITITGGLVDVGEAVLRRWTRRWDSVLAQVGADWQGDPYDSGDFENALCIFQEPPHATLPDPAAFTDTVTPRRRRTPGC